MTTPYPVPPAVEEPLGAVTRVLALTEDPDGENQLEIGRASCRERV